MAIKRPKGTQDILPEQAGRWQWLEEQIREICRQYGYEEIRTPIFEPTELFQRGVGETTDIVNKEMYTFQDKGDRSMTLRPEGTASVGRAYVENKLYGQPQPWKLYYIGPMFRYENTQAGRFRQFHQFGVEVLGLDDPFVDGEAILLVWDLYQRLGLRGLEVRLNSVGCPVCRETHRQKLRAFLTDREEGLCRDCKERLEKNPMRILDCKNEHCQELTKGAPTTFDHLCPECRSHFESLCRILEAVGVSYQIDPRLVRGLDYYRKTAFEVLVEGIGAQSAICGGGRYDGLVEEIGGPSTPGIGFAMGMERVLASLENQEIKTRRETPVKIVMAALGERARLAAAGLAHDLRQQGYVVLQELAGKSLKSQMKFADRQQAALVLIQGEEELERGTVILRQMALGQQCEVPKENIVKEIEKMLYSTEEM